MPLARVLTFWRRSIQARVVASTLVLSLLVVSIVGWFLIQQTRDGLLEHRVNTALVQAQNETAEARNRLSAASGTVNDAQDQRAALVNPIIALGASRGFAVVMSPPLSAGGDLGSGVRSTLGLDLSSVPTAMQRRYAEPRGTSWTYTEIKASDPTQSAFDQVAIGPGVVVASQITLPADNETYTLYYLFPLDEAGETLGLVTRALLTAAALLMLLVAGITWLVTRQVVTPVREVRRVAERLAAGELQERLDVRGEDDLARLATSFNQMAANLQRQIRQLEELSRLQRRFVSDVSHELRTPLTTVRMAGDVLHDARSDFDPATFRASELLQKELDRFETLLADLLEISRFDAGAAGLEAEDVNLVDVAHRVAELAQPLARSRRTRIVVRDPGRPCVAEADVRRVERILRNLVNNAIDHAESRDVVIDVGASDSAAAVTVRDYGVGLGPGEAGMVFNRFWRGDPARARSSGGTGLGLSIALEDAHLHGGWLQAWGHKGAGAQFRLTLPRRQGEPLRQSPLSLIPADGEVGR